MLINITYKSYSNRIIDEKEIDNKRVAIKVDNGNKEYKDSETLPGRGYVLNTELTECLDIEGNKIENIKLDSNGENITITGRYTSYCTLYFDEGDNLIKDLSGHNNNGLNHAVLTDEEGVTTSKDEKVGYIDCGLAGYDFKNSVTVILRLRWNSFNTNTSYQTFAGNIPHQNRTGFVFSMASSSRKPYVEIYNNSSNLIYFDDLEVNLNEWYTLVFIYDNKNMITYKNGLKKEVTSTVTLGVSSLPIFLGAYPVDETLGPSDSDFAYVTFTDVVIYDRALSEEEVRTNYIDEIDPSKINKENILLYYRFIN